jgi:hypothetical protein
MGGYIKIDLQEVVCGSTDWIKLAQNRYRQQALANAVMNILRFNKMWNIS